MDELIDSLEYLEDEVLAKALDFAQQILVALFISVYIALVGLLEGGRKAVEHLLDRVLFVFEMSPNHFHELLCQFSLIEGSVLQGFCLVRDTRYTIFGLELWLLAWQTTHIIVATFM